MEEKEKSFVHADYNFLRKIVWFHMVLRRTKGTDRWMGIALGGVYVFFSHSHIAAFTQNYIFIDTNIELCSSKEHYIFKSEPFDAERAEES
jgi:hypothetical protein